MPRIQTTYTFTKSGCFTAASNFARWLKEHAAKQELLAARFINRRPTGTVKEPAYTIEYECADDNANTFISGTALGFEISAAWSV